MSICACRYDGDLETKAHRDHHRAWEDSRPTPPPTVTADDVLALMVRQDQLEARVVECERRLGVTPLPLSAGAQAILNRSARKARHD